MAEKKNASKQRAKQRARQYKKAIFMSDGSYASIARIMKVQVQSVKDYLAKHPEHKEFIKARKAILVDNAESILCEIVAEKYFPAVKFVLERLAKDRYGEVKEPAEGETSINIILSSEASEGSRKYKNVEELVRKVKGEQ